MRVAMIYRYKKGIIAVVLFALLIGFLIYKTPKGPAYIYNTYARPSDFKEGLWIVKYPGNHECFRFETPDSFRIVTDPYQMDEYVSPDILTISHYHPDHCDTSKLGGKYRLFDKAGVYNAGRVSITGVKGLHDNPRVPSTGNMPNVIFVFDIDGIRIAHFASQGVYPTEDMFRSIGKADILVIQLGDGGKKMSLKECGDVVTRLGARLVIPAHGDQSLDPAFAEMLHAGIRYVDNGEMIVTRKELDEKDKPEILVLDSY